MEGIAGPGADLPIGLHGVLVVRLARRLSR
jgi:hypothetical protein